MYSEKAITILKECILCNDKTLSDIVPISSDSQKQAYICSYILLICVALVFRFQEADAYTISTYLPTVLNIERANLAWHFNWHLIKQTNFGIKYHHRLLCKEAEASSGILGSHGMVPYIIVAAYCYTQPIHSGYSRSLGQENHLYSKKGY